jgi:hypothetical protein
MSTNPNTKAYQKRVSNLARDFEWAARGRRGGKRLSDLIAEAYAKLPTQMVRDAVAQARKEMSYREDLYREQAQECFDALFALSQIDSGGECGRILSNVFALPKSRRGGAA